MGEADSVGRRWVFLASGAVARRSRPPTLADPSSAIRSVPRRHGRFGFFGPKRLEHGVGLRVADGLKPAATTHLVEPPFAVLAAFVFAGVDVVSPFLRPS